MRNPGRLTLEDRTIVFTGHLSDNTRSRFGRRKPWMLADVCDVYELKSGHQRQAFYGGVFVTCDKIALGVGLLLSGYLLAWSGYNAAIVEQMAKTISYWSYALLVSQPTGFVLGILVFLTYPIIFRDMQMLC